MHPRRIEDQNGLTEDVLVLGLPGCVNLVNLASMIVQFDVMSGTGCSSSPVISIDQRKVGANVNNCADVPFEESAVWVKQRKNE